jgi:hypothetical protein
LLLPSRLVTVMVLVCDIELSPGLVGWWW